MKELYKGRIVWEKDAMTMAFASRDEEEVEAWILEQIKIWPGDSEATITKVYTD